MNAVVTGQRLSLALALALMSSQTLAAPFAQPSRATLDNRNPVVSGMRADRSTAELNLMQIDSSALSVDSDRLELRLATNRSYVVRRSGAIGEAPEILSAELDAQFQEKHSGTRPIVLVANDYVYLDKDMGHPGPLTRLTERSKKLLRRGGSDSNQSDRAAND